VPSEGRIDDVVVGIDHAQRLPAAERTGHHVELGGVGAASSDFHHHAAARAALDPYGAREVEDCDVVAGEGVALDGLREDGGRHAAQRGAEGDHGTHRTLQ